MVNTEKSFQNLSRWNENQTQFLSVGTDKDGVSVIQCSKMNPFARILNRVLSLFGFGSFQKVCTLCKDIFKETSSISNSISDKDKQALVDKLNKKIDRYNHKWFHHYSIPKIKIVAQDSLKEKTLTSSDTGTGGTTELQPLPIRPPNSSGPTRNIPPDETRTESLLSDTNLLSKQDIEKYQDLLCQMREQATEGAHTIFDPQAPNRPLVGIIGAPVNVLYRNISDMSPEKKEENIKTMTEMNIDKEENPTEERKQEIREEAQVKVTNSFKKLKAEEDLEAATYTTIGTGFDACCVRGDGHCMFRSVAFSLIHGFLPNDIDGLEAIIHGCYDRLDRPELNHPQKIEEITVQSKKTIEISFRLLREGIPLELVMRNEEISDAWVQVLRAVVIKEEAKKIQEAPEFLQNVAWDLGELGEIPGLVPRITKHLENLANPGEREYGGAIELFCFASLFGMPITILQYEDVRTNGRPEGTVLVPPEGHTSNVKPIFLLRKNPDAPHYDVLFRKEQS